MGAWWNGRHGGLKIHWPRGREGSSPSAPTQGLASGLLDCGLAKAKDANRAPPLGETPSINVGVTSA